jgi:hypothetical protein
MSQKNLKRVGIGLLIIPLGVLFLFAFGEVFSGEISGFQHLVQAAPIIILAFLAYKKPFVGGLLLLIAGLTLGILYALRAPFNFQTIVLAELLLFVPPAISGSILILSSSKK